MLQFTKAFVLHFGLYVVYQKSVTSNKKKWEIFHLFSRKVIWMNALHTFNLSNTNTYHLAHITI